VLHLLPSAPPELIDAASGTLARLHHPDVGGDPETMRTLNDARDALRLGGAR
jgi:curved DNA-binding protein CbpA